MGKAHAMAYKAVVGAFPDIQLRPKLIAVADVNGVLAAKAAHQFGFEVSTDRWQDLINDSAIEVISITTPNAFHREMAEAAARAGKHIHCEKPLAPSVEDAKAMMEAASTARVQTQVGFNYIKNPLLKQARKMIAEGELGEIVSFHGRHAEDYMADPEIPFNWRVDGSGGGGAISEIGSHIICLARFLLGPITQVYADLETVIKTRPSFARSTERSQVMVDDIARMLVRFERGCSGSIEANWLATGRKMQLEFEVVGTKGSLSFTQERLNELMFYDIRTPSKVSGFARIEAGPQHQPYGNFCPAPGHQLGFNDLKTIEMAEFMEAIASGNRTGPDFEEAWQIQRVIDAAIQSSRRQTWNALNAG